MSTHETRSTQSNEGAIAPAVRRFRRARGILIPIAAAVGVVAACSTPATSTSVPEKTTASTTTAPSSLRPLPSGFYSADPQNDVGRVDCATHFQSMSLQFRLSDAQKASSTALVAAQQDPASPAYHHWLSPEEYGARFGATPGAVAQVQAWLEAQGLTIDRVSRASTRIYFSGSVAQVEAAFQTQIHHYDVGGRIHFAPATPALVPASIGEVVSALAGVDDFAPRPPKHTLTRSPEYTFDAGPPDAGLPPTIFHLLAPEDFAKIYDVPNLFSSATTKWNGDNTSIAIIGQSYYNVSDFNRFRTRFGLPATTIVDHLVPGSGNNTYDEDGLIEASLDLEWSGAVAPNATIHYVYTGDSQQAFFLNAIAYGVDEAIAPILSASFSLCEGDASLLGLTSTEFADELLELGNQASLEGITVLAASGDTGAAGCDPNDGPAQATKGLKVGIPQSIPSVTSVGGTTITSDSAFWAGSNDAHGGSVILSATPPAFPVDTAWNDTFANPAAPSIGATGGGASALFAKPVWQIVGTPTDSHRDTPDLALSAGGGGVSYLVEFSYTAADGADAAVAVPQELIGVGGTSCATPAFAGMMALLNQALVAKNVLVSPGLGNINPQLYALQANPGSTLFRDVTVGDNCVPCKAGSTGCPTTATGACGKIGEYGFKTAVGYDQVTGLGTVDAQNMIETWEALLPTSIALVATPDPAQTGTSVTLKATVSSTATAGPVISGTVEFYDQNADHLGNGTIAAGVASLAVTTLPPGTDEIFATYGGDTHYVGSFTEATFVVTDDAGDGTLGGGLPVVIFDAGLDASLPPLLDAGFDASLPILDAGLDASLPILDAGLDASSTIVDAGHDGGTADGGKAANDGGKAASDAGTDGAASGDDSGTSSGDDDSGSTSGDDDSGSASGDDAGSSSDDSGTIVVNPPDDAGDDTDAATTADAGGTGGSSSSGCSCVVAGGQQDSGTSREGALGGVLFAGVVLMRRRRARR